MKVVVRWISGPYTYLFYTCLVQSISGIHCVVPVDQQPFHNHTKHHTKCNTDEIKELYAWNFIFDRENFVVLQSERTYIQRISSKWFFDLKVDIVDWNGKERMKQVIEQRWTLADWSLYLSMFSIFPRFMPLAHTHFVSVLIPRHVCECHAID